MKKQSLIFVFLVWTTSLFGLIVESVAISDILDYADNESLIVLDLNDTLMKPCQNLGSDQWASDEINKEMDLTGKSKSQVLDTFVPKWHKILIASPFKAVESMTPSVIRNLQKQGVKLVGLTARYIEMAYPTLEQLHFIDVELNRCTVLPHDLEINGAYASKFIEGVIFVGLKNDKGETLFRFLDQIQYTPKKIVFVDDKRKNIDSLEKATTKRGIPFIGIHYRYVHQNTAPYSPEIATKQLQHFNSVLSDLEAEKLLSLRQEGLALYNE